MQHNLTTEKLHEKVIVFIKDDKIKRSVEADSLILG